mgnify:CR=1 FL=1
MYIFQYTPFMLSRLFHFVTYTFYLSSFVFYFNLCSALNLFVEDWESGNLNQWNSWGSPLPILNSSETAIGNYSLDPNGDGSYHSGIVSKQMFDLSSGVRFTLDAFIESASAWSELEFGLVDGIGGLWGLSKVIHEELELKGNFRNLKFIKLKKDISFKSILENLEDPSDFAKGFLLDFVRPMILAI